MKKFARRITHSPALGLYFLAPLVAEFFLGDFTITALPLLLPLSLWYGGCALAIREFVRRRGGGWPSILLFGLVFGVVEEGLLTMSLFNPNYLGLRLLDSGYADALGIGIPWTVFVLALHTGWSIAAPVALMEEAAGPRRHEPWLEGRQYAVLAVVVVLGLVVTIAGNLAANDGYVATFPHLLAAAMIATGLAAFATAVARRESTPNPDRHVPSPMAVAGLTVCAGALFETQRAVGAVAGTVLMLVAIVGLTTAVAWWSRSPVWSSLHRVAVAGGAIAAYVGTAFVSGYNGGGASVVLAAVSHVVFAAAAAAIVFACVMRARRSPDRGVVIVDPLRIGGL